MHPYFAVQAAQTVEARAAQPGDLEASGDAFDPRTAPSVFRIGDSLVVSREVGLTLKVVELKEVVLSECHPA